jgi:hypothetical protein
MQVVEDIAGDLALPFNTKAIKWNISGVPQNKNVRFSELTELYHPTFLVTTRMIILLIMCGHLLAIFFPSRSSEEESI